MLRLSLIVAGLVALSGMAAADPIEDTVGACVSTKITSIGTRLEGQRWSGSALRYENGITQVSYYRERPIERSKVGDLVRICLVHLPQHCPANDTRGKVYRAHNLRTSEQWILPNSAHDCGGA